ncbi:SusC/RagA family TonB-linked outer membrane protein [Tenacibaculum singaporense]|uniref:SusC/RagA family TonB-linked outer membrane protein n=1 Tax=Tenacibaculum singaporense TaxID=2358479 RepID=UPI000F68232C|nr:SusC/RagA family TonB-linked outer membrane protein [Tenacibaculum singaporense]RSC92132.1 SusC/RagA family TonB-linked outer membrane protein [Tenacibaculum singaporense]
MNKKIIYLLLLIPFSVFAQNTKTISGTVIDEARNETLPGVSIYASTKMIGNKTNIDGVIQASMIGTTTDFDGNFSFKAPAETKYIIISYIGFETEKVNVENRSTNMIITLEEKEELLGEVIVMGYQKIEKRKITSSFAKIKTDDVKRAGTANIDQMLSGEISGVLVQPTNGAPGAPAKIQIRGTSTLNGSSDPLWILDGIPLQGNDIPKDFRDKDNIDNLKSFPIAGINPEDIEEITVLKDASATSIYGARAANGVIVITTKKGKEGAMRINFNASTFLTLRPDFDKLNLMSASEKVDFELGLASRPDLTYQSNRGEVARILDAYGEYDNFQNNGFSSINPLAQNAINNLRNQDVNWGNKLYQAAINQQYGLTLSGGSEKSRYYFSLGYFDEEGTTKGTGLNRYNLTFKNDYDVNDKLNVGVSVFASRNKSTSYITGADAYTNPAYYSRRVNPYFAPYNADGSFNYDPDLIERYDLSVSFKYNPLEERQNTNQELTSYSIKPIIDLTYKFNSNLKLYTQFGMQFDFDKTEKFSDKESYYTRKYRFRSRYQDDNGQNAFFLPEGGIIQNWNSDAFQYNWKSTLNYNTSINNIHEIDVMLGTEFREDKRTEIHTKGFGFNPNTLSTVQITDERALKNKLFEPYRKTVNENAYASFFGTASYTYDRKYTIFGSLRYDGSNLFGVNPKFRYLPLWSVAGSWNVAKEDFFDVDAIDEFKIRGSYGVQGNIDKSTSPYVVGLYDEVTILPGTTEEGINVISAPNKDLRWEKTVSSNVGFDLGMFNNRVYVSADYYYRKSTDLIGLQAIPLESGFNFINTNWATLSNKGVELAINTRNIVKDDFTWTTSFNISHNKNTVERIQTRDNDFKPSLLGYGVNAVFAIKTAGLDSNGLPLFWKDGKKVTAVDFYNLSEGVDGNQLTREEHRNLYTYVGNGDPEFSGGFINKFQYKDFSLSIATNFNLNQTVRRTPSYHPTQVSPNYNFNKEVLQAGTGNYPALIGSTTPGFDTGLVYSWYHTYDSGNTFRDLDIWVDKISYIRVNSIKFGYNVPSKYLESMNVSRLSFNLEGRNLFVFGTDYDGYFDPETFGSPYSQPIPKIISFGFNLSF